MSEGSVGFFWFQVVFMVCFLSVVSVVYRSYLYVKELAYLLKSSYNISILLDELDLEELFYK